MGGVHKEGAVKNKKMARDREERAGIGPRISRSA
jgi:hypothetical protein